MGGPIFANIGCGIEPKNSNDHGVPRMTWWPRRGTEEWLYVRFDEVKKASRADVYWFDDTGGGQCRVPASWALDYLDGDQWKPVASDGPFPVAVDKYNHARFEPVKTKAMRLRVKLQSDFSGGVLELKVE